MNKKELIAKLADSCGVNQAQAGDFVNAFCDTVVEQLKTGDGATVALPGFGSFIAKHKPSRSVRNPSTGQQMMTKPKTVTQFKPSAALKDL